MLFDGKDPTKIFYSGKPYDIVKEKGTYKLHLKLPFVSREKINLFQVGDELTIQIENQRRNLFLPSFLARLKVDKANFEDGLLKISFEKHEKKSN